MKTSYQAVVIGGGVVGASVLYHLAKLGWSDVALIERAELTAGSSWHAAGGFHTVNADPNMAALQDYTINLYKEIQEESGQDVGLHMTGGINFATTPERWEMLKANWAAYQSMGIETSRLVTPEEIGELCPIVSLEGVVGGLFDANEGHLDPYGATHAFAGAARKRGADVILRNRVIELNQRVDGSWDVVTEKGTIHAEHVVNCGGLWAKQVGLMAGVDLPVTPLEHHYLITDTAPEIAALSKELPLMVDLDGFTYMRHEGQGALLGVYEVDHKHWNMEGAPWDYGMELIQEDLPRIEKELMMGFERYPCLQETGIKRWVNGAFTFTPDGNPIMGPVPGVRNYWTACGVMAGFAQGGGVGLSLAQWMVNGEPGADIYGMDVARYGGFAANREYLKQTTGQFYSRRFVMAYPNEQLPAGRALKTAGAFDAMTRAGARWSANWGLETPLYFAEEGFEEIPSQKRSNAHDIIAAECRATREGVGLLDISAFARYEVSGDGAREWLNKLLACKLPAKGRVKLAPMLTESGRMKGDLTVLNWDDETFWIMGSYYLRAWHMRWFNDHLPETGVTVRDIADDWVGFSLSGPNARAVLERVVRNADVSAEGMKFLACRDLEIGLCNAKVARISLSGELGYEINVPASQHLALYNTLKEAGKDLGLVDIGFNAMLSLRMEKSIGIWNAEFTNGYTPGQCGMNRFVAFDKGDFIGRDAALKERDETPSQQMIVTLEIKTEEAEAANLDPIWLGERRVGFVTSGAYGHCVEKNLALAFVDRDVIEQGLELEVHIAGIKRKATIIADSPYDSKGSCMRV